MIKFQDNIPSGTLPGELLHGIALRWDDIGKTQIYEYIIDLLLDRSFGSEVQSQRSSILLLMPELESSLLASNTQVRSLKIALEAAKLTKTNRVQENRLIYEAAFISLCYCHIVKRTGAMPNIALFNSFREISELYPESKDFCANEIGELEQRKLVSFANFMRVALTLMQKPKKAHLLDLVTRISEGKSAKYVTGSGQTILTSRRVQIFQRESGVKPTPRPPRRGKDERVNSEQESYVRDPVMTHNQYLGPMLTYDHFKFDGHDELSSSKPFCVSKKRDASGEIMVKDDQNMNDEFEFAASVLSNIKQQNTSIIMDRESCAGFEPNDRHGHVDSTVKLEGFSSVKSEEDRHAPILFQSNDVEGNDRKRFRVGINVGAQQLRDSSRNFSVPGLLTMGKQSHCKAQ